MPTDTPNYYDLIEGISCIDTGYYRPGLAASYLMVQGEQAAFIDTGTYHSVPVLLELLKNKGIQRENVAYVMPTHAHLDHAGGAGELMRCLPNATLIAHPRAARHLIDPEKLIAGALAVYGEAEFAKGFGRLVPVPEHRVSVIEDGFTLDFNGRPLLFLDTPGHARHHYSIFDDVSQGFFTGDTFGISYPELDCGSTPLIFPSTTPVQFDPDAWHRTIDRYLQFNPTRVFLTHFGMITEILGLADTLRRGIDAFVELAQCVQRSVPERHQYLLKGMTEILITEARRLDPNVSTEFCQALYAFDLELNTQGLEVWLDRQSQSL